MTDEELLKKLRPKVIEVLKATVTPAVNLEEVSIFTSSDDGSVCVEGKWRYDFSGTEWQSAVTELWRYGLIESVLGANDAMGKVNYEGGVGFSKLSQRGRCLADKLRQ